MPAPNLYRLQVSGPAGPELVKAIATTRPLSLDILDADSGDFSGLDKSAVTVARAIVDKLAETFHFVPVSWLRNVEACASKTAPLISVTIRN